MPVNRVNFKISSGCYPDMESLTEDILELVGLMRNNGQVISDSDICVPGEGSVYIDVRCPEVNSLDKKNNNIYVNEYIERISRAHNAIFSYVTIDGDKSTNVEIAYEEASFFILYWNGYSPLRSANNFEPIPLYFFSYNSRDRSSYDDIRFWWNDYDAVYRIWVRGNIDEQLFYTYLSNIESPLNRQGIEVCRNLENLSGKNFYYYLFSYDDNRGAHCPSCGGVWELETPLFGEFQFKCDHCRIISNE